MKITIKDFENNTLIETEILDYKMQGNSVVSVIIPEGDYSAAEEIMSTDLLVVHLETTALNYQGQGRMFEVLAALEGPMLRIKFDTAADIN